MFILDISKQLTDVLLELRNASLSIDSERELKETMTKYDMLFLGENFNKINSIELKHSLKVVFDLELTSEQLLDFLPKACETLNMPLEGLQAVDNPGVVSAYFITLH